MQQKFSSKNQSQEDFKIESEDAQRECTSVVMPMQPNVMSAQHQQRVQPIIRQCIKFDILVINFA